MPLIRIELLDGHSEAELSSIADNIHLAVVAAFKVPQTDRYQIITEHKASHFVVEDTGLGITRSKKVVFIQVFTRPHDVAAKECFYKTVTDNLEKQCGIPGSDVVISCIVNSDEDWSFGYGRAQFLTGEL
jgi:phenylpyruvate tautomerase PptA (4-oxalocrotonate tautomerase family)